MAKSRDKHRPKRRIYKRKGFWIFLCLCGVVAAAGLYEGKRRLEPYKEQADAVDISTIDDVEIPSLILDNKGRELGRLYVENRSKISIDEVPEKLIDALRAQEDQRYFEHAGVDWTGVARAVYLNLKAGEVTQGASTITMQLARNAFDLKAVARDREQSGMERKVVEAFLALRIEEAIQAQLAAEFPDETERKKQMKRQVLEYYLNRIPFGSGFYGVRSAALGYFGKEPMALNVEECASLVACIKNPTDLTPLRFPERNRIARDHVLNRMLAEDMITKSEWNTTTGLPVKVSPKPLRRGVSHLYEKVAGLARAKVGMEAMSRGGFKIYTTIDRDLQDQAERSLAEQLGHIESTPGYAHVLYSEFESAPGKETPYLQGAALLIDSTTSNVLAHIGGRNFEHSTYDFIADGKRPMGTAFLPVIYTASFNTGAHPCDSVRDERMDNRAVMIGGREGVLGEWGMETTKPRYEGRITARRALSSSKIAASVRLGRELGLDAVAKQAEAFGFKIDSENLLNRMLLGSETVSLSEAVRAFTAFSRKGKVPRSLRYIERIENAEGDVEYLAPIPEGAGRFMQACDEESAFQIHSVLRDSLTTGNLAEDAGLLAKGFPGVAKTGTTYTFSDGWCVGYNGTLSLGIWVGFHSGNQPIYDNAFGRRLAFRPWAEIMNRAGTLYPGKEPEAPATLEPVKVCSKSGLLATRYCYEPADGEAGESGGFRYAGYAEMVRIGRDKLGLCDVHGQGGVGSDQILAAYGPEALNSGRRQQVTVSPIRPRAEVLLGEDPYNAELLDLPAEDTETELFISSPSLSRDFIVPGEADATLRLERPAKIEIQTD